MKVLGAAMKASQSAAIKTTRDGSQLRRKFQQIVTIKQLAVIYANEQKALTIT